MQLNINTSELLNILLSTGFISMIGLVLRLQIELTKAKNDIEHLTNEIRELKELIKDCVFKKP